MPTYRILYKEELEDLKIEFVRFLSAHSITSQDWEKMKANQKQKSMKWIELFSDMVFDTILKKIELLELRLDSEIKFLTFDEKNTYMVGLVIDGAVNIDFSQNEDPAEMITRFQEENGVLKIIRGERPHQDTRELEIFKSMAQGYLISKNKALYKSIKEIISSQNKK